MIVEIAAAVLVYLAFTGFAAKRLLTYMHILQQEEYNNARTLAWMFQHNGFDKRLTLAIFLIGGASFVIHSFATSALLFLCFTLMAYIERDPRKNSKKKLVQTARVNRIFFPAVITSTLLASWYLFTGPLWTWLWIINIQALPFILFLTNKTLQPVEENIQKAFWDEAYSKIEELNPTIIGITGSFGKTSVKHILGHILKSYAPALITPGSVNTPMGITRIIREDLDERHKYFIVEMGAYGPGSIERLCKLTPPDYGIITALGHAHYERFKSLETVAETKFELAQAILNKHKDEEKRIIVHEKTLRFPYTMNMALGNRTNFLACGELPSDDPENVDVSFHVKGCDIKIKKIEQLPEGLEVVLKWKKDTCYLTLPLYGVHHAHNAALAFATAVTIGVPVDDVITAFKSVPQIPHRLEVKKHNDGTIFIDDAFNSNPLGFHAALELMAMIGSKEGRKILITPGMVELGAAHDEAHETIGRLAAQMCDIALVICPERIESFIKAFKTHAPDKLFLPFNSFQEAALWLEDNKRANDTILIENDLPDIYESIPKF